MNGDTKALGKAACEGDLAAAKALLDAGADPDERGGQDALTPLHIAIRGNDLAMAALLVEHGARLDLTSRAGISAEANPFGRDFGKEGRNAYHYAAESTREIMEFLLRQKNHDAAAAFFTQHGVRLSALRAALGAGDRAMAELLLDDGASVNDRDERGDTPLHFLLRRCGKPQAVLPLLRLLIARGADIADGKAANNGGETPLFDAVRGPFPEAAGILLALGCGATHKNRRGRTPLHIAVEKWDGAKIVRLLIDHGAEMNARDEDGSTPLHVAAYNNRADIVKILLDAGADPFVKDNAGARPDEICLPDLQKSVRKLLLDRQAEVTAHKTAPGSRLAQNRSFGPFGNRG